ncbi:hypothetical protein C438_00725 [Haloferax denitrificans ATCC 35960]|uniref:Uncharacterized protein n=1 Tax=Haloferax denitrificans ATCC 35960 TaxID=662478 RepID=M0JIY1_9EURY|nr:hypothetical protein C438_00725 [Haloferax denitrificans ATCC 35960]
MFKSGVLLSNNHLEYTFVNLGSCDRFSVRFDGFDGSVDSWLGYKAVRDDCWLTVEWLVVDLLFDSGFFDECASTTSVIDYNTCGGSVVPCRFGNLEALGMEVPDVHLLLEDVRWREAQTLEHPFGFVDGEESFVGFVPDSTAKKRWESVPVIVETDVARSHTEEDVR